MGSFEDVRKALEEVVSPSLIGLKAEVTGLQSNLTLFRSDVVAMETRLMKAIESAKTEVLLRVQVADLNARNADLEARLAEAEKERRQTALQQQSLGLVPPPTDLHASQLSK